MNLLGFDTATSATAVGVLHDDGRAWTAVDLVGKGQRPHHATELLPLADRLLGQAGLGFSDLDGVVVGIGPGTFTGLRIGIATARGLAQSLGIGLTGVGTLRTLATGMDGPCLAVLDARRGEAFVAAYEEGRELIAPTAVPTAELAAFAVGAAARGCVAVGEGAVAFRAQLEGAAVMVAPDESPAHNVDAALACRLVANGHRDGSGPVTPLYLRLPDAELALRRGNR